MKKIGFIGAFDKTDLIICIAKILTEMGNQVLVVDGTLTQKAKYIVPVIKPSKSYVTSYEGIDIAVGFENFNSIKQFLAMPQMLDFNYDISLIDLDTIEGVQNFELENFEKNYFVTSNDLYSIKRGIETINSLEHPIQATKVLFSRGVSNATLQKEDDYLNFLSSGSKIIWKDEKIYFPFEIGDQTVLYENQSISKITFKKLSTQYKQSLLYLTNKILDEKDYNLLKKTFKKLERGV